MKLLIAFLFALSFNAMAQDRVDVPFGETETILTRASSDTKKQVAVFSWQETVRGTERVCVQRSIRYRYIYCRDRNGRRRICGRRAVTVCTRYETRSYTRVVNYRNNVRLKFEKSARRGFRGAEQYRVIFNKATRCGTVSAANTNAERRDIDNKGCRRAIIR